MNRITLAQKKVLSVLSTFALILLFSWKQDPGEAYAIARQIVQSIDSGKGAVKLTTNAENGYIATLFEEHFRDSTFYKTEKSRQWLSRDAGNLNVKDESYIIDEVFTQKNYELAKRQASGRTWDAVQWKAVYPQAIIVEDKAKSQREKVLKVSYPIFLEDQKYALVYYIYGGQTALLIFSRTAGHYEQAKFIPLALR